MTSALLSRIVASLAVALGVAVQQNLIPPKYAGLGVIALAGLQAFLHPVTQSSSDNTAAAVAVAQNQAAIPANKA
jgi:hypothetical protein